MHLYIGARDVAKSSKHRNMIKEIAANFEAFFEIDTFKSGRHTLHVVNIGLDTSRAITSAY